jgi:hypothetical protein
MTANDYQVGGDHYRSAYIHWDWVIKIGLGYLDGQASKYLVRFRKKGGESDLCKAIHYVEKLVENADRIVSTRRNLKLVRKETMAFARANGLVPEVAAVVMRLATWEIVEDLHEVVIAMQVLLDRPLASQPDTAPVPAEDSNKHAERERMVPRYES